MTIAAAPGNPSAGLVRVYAPTATSLRIRDSAGTETDLAVTGGGYTQGARVRHSVNQSVAHNGDIVLAFNTEDFDTDAIHDTVTNNSRLTCKTAGKYLIYGRALWDYNVAGGRDLYINLNNLTKLAEELVIATDDGDANRMGVVTTYDLAVNDYVELRAFQNSGVALNVLTSGSFTPVFGMQRIG